MNDHETTPVVDAIGQLNIEGNVVPPSWLNHLRTTVRRKGEDGKVHRTTERGKPALLAAMILADIVYWYRPTILRDEKTGKVIGTRRKFSGNVLQRDARYYVNLFGVSKGQAQCAIQILEQAGVIRRELRTVTTKTGLTLSNVQYIEPVPERVREITYRQETNSLQTPSPEKTDTLPVKNRHPIPKKRTHTNISTPVNTGTTTTLSADAESTSGDTDISAPVAPVTATPKNPPKDKAKAPAPVDIVQDTFDRAVKAQAHPAAQVIQNWNLPVYLTPICLRFQHNLQVEVRKTDKGLWASGASAIYELHPTTEQFDLACQRMAGAKDVNGQPLTVTHPRAIYQAIKQVMREQVAGDEGGEENEFGTRTYGD